METNRTEIEAAELTAMLYATISAERLATLKTAAEKQGDGELVAICSRLLANPAQGVDMACAIAALREPAYVGIR